MSTFSKVSALAVASVFLASCSLRPESSLVYGSRQHFGVGIQSDPNGNPIPGFTLGYSSKDFAKVPVAVQLDKDEPDQITLIWGSYCEGNAQSESACASLFEGQSVAIVDIERLAEESDLAANDLRDAVDEASNNLGIPSFTATERYSAFRLSSSVSVGDLRTEIRDSILDRKRPNFGATDEERDQLTDAVAANVAQKNVDDVIRKDAFSVFGSFNSVADESSATLGKVFATGVAAQTVAEATSIAAKARCLEAAKANDISADQAVKLCE